MNYKRKLRSKLAMTVATLVAASAGTFSTIADATNASAVTTNPANPVVTSQPSVYRTDQGQPTFIGGIFNGVAGASIVDLDRSGALESIDGNAKESKSVGSGVRQDLAFHFGREIITGDFDGDGQTDFVNPRDNTTMPVYMQRRSTWDGSSGPGTFFPFTSNLPDFLNVDSNGLSKWATGDFNHDGKTDLANILAGGVNRISIAFSDGVSGSTLNFHVTDFPAGDFPVWANSANVTVSTGDFNGDGRTDLTLTGGSGWASIPVAFSNGDGTFNITNASSPTFAQWASTPGAHVIAGHFDASHRERTGLALTGASGWRAIPVANSNGDGTFTLGNGLYSIFGSSPYDFGGWAATPGVKIVPGDFSYDGLTDLVLTGVPGWTTIPMARATGDGNWTVTNSSSPAFAGWAAAPHVTVVAASTSLLLVGGDGWYTLPRAFSIGDGSFDVLNLQNSGTRRFAYWAQSIASPNGVPAEISGNHVISTLKDGFSAGDCFEWGQSSHFMQLTTNLASSITLTLLDASGSVNVDWDARLSTDRSFFGDVWHGHFNFKNDAGGQLATASLDGPEMDGPPQILGDITNKNISTTIHIDPAQFNNITNVDWSGAC